MGNILSRTCDPAVRVLPDNPPVDPPDPPTNPPCSPPTPSPKCPLGSSNGSFSHTIAHHHRRHHTQIGQESKAATKIQASFRGMRERRQRKKEESAALKIQAVHRGRKVRRDLDFRSVAQKKKAGAEVGDEMLEMKNRMIAMRAKMKERERKVDALKLKKIKRMESGVDGAQGSSYFGAEKKRLERKETMRTKRAMRR